MSRQYVPDLLYDAVIPILCRASTADVTLAWHRLANRQRRIQSRRYVPERPHDRVEFSRGPGHRGIAAEVLEVASGDLVQVDDAGRELGVRQALVLQYRRCDLVEDGLFEGAGLFLRAALGQGPSVASDDSVDMMSGTVFQTV